MLVDNLTTGKAALVVAGGELAVNGSQTFQVGAPDTSDPSAITVSISEDAWAGEAQFVLSVDGTQVGGIRTATASPPDLRRFRAPDCSPPGRQASP